MIFTKAVSTRKIIAGESMAKRTAKLSEEQKRESLCGRPYKKLAERVAEADTTKPNYDASCKPVIDVLDDKCFKPMSEGKEPTGQCNSALQTISKWKEGPRFCKLTEDVVNG